MTGIWLVSFILLWSIVLIEGVFLVALLRAVGGIHLKFEDLVSSAFRSMTPGDTLEDRPLTSLTGEEFKLSDLWRGRNLLLLMASTDCLPCRETLETFSTISFPHLQATFNTCLVCAGPTHTVEYFVEDVGIPPEIPVIALEETSLATEYRVVSTPTLAIIGTDGRVREVLVGKADAENFSDLLNRWSVATAMA